MAESAYIAAALQVHCARLAATLAASALTAIDTGVCPACGGRPVASIIAGAYGVEGVRYAVCSFCATEWNEVRVKCLSCGSTKGIGYQVIDGGAETIKAETCDECSSYLKVFYRDKDMQLEPVADDVASLGLDVLLRGAGKYRRAGINPFMAGY